MARKRVLVTTRSDGSWSVRDEELGYRICTCHQEHKYPSAPSHIHDRFDAVIAPCTISQHAVAERVMIAHRVHHTALDLDALQQEVNVHGHPHDL